MEEVNKDLLLNKTKAKDNTNNKDASEDENDDELKRKIFKIVIVVGGIVLILLITFITTYISLIESNLDSDDMNKTVNEIEMERALTGVWRVVESNNFDEYLIEIGMF
jgi:heme/copper-type cytochrome/quinol oxidase subunit 2